MLNNGFGTNIDKSPRLRYMLTASNDALCNKIYAIRNRENPLL